LNALLDWRQIDLVVFDVDGTLYDQRRLRLAMLRRLLAATWQTRSLDTLKTLRTFRQVREALGDHPEADFMRLQYARTASRRDTSEAQVRALTAEWMEQRPLPLLAGCRYPHLDTLFAGLRAAGKQVAVFSDYPALDKLAALGLQARPVVCATDAGIARLKPDPLGLLEILRQTGVAAQRALMIGDRFDRDALAASRAGVRALIRSRQPHPEFDTFRAYDDPVFQPMLNPSALQAAA
jgi:phosphoglycolate phosphatase/putative hydrolase of the HAD superfamily